MKKKLVAALAMGLIMSGMVGMANAATININAKNNAANNPISLSFEAGTYDITPISVADGGLYTSWSVHYGYPDTWTHRYSFSSNEFGEINIGGIGSGPYYANENIAFGHAIATTFTLENAGTVNFYVFDGPNGYGYAYDNVGGVSLNVDPVPIPGAVWLLGGGLIGLAGIRRKKK